MEEYKYLGFFSTNTQHNSLNILDEIRTLKKIEKNRILINSGAISISFININYIKT